MKIKDRFILSSITGTIAALFADLFLYIINLFIPGNNINMPGLTLELFLNIDPNNFDTVSQILGFVWSLIVGAVYAFIFIILLDITGWNNLLTKSFMLVLNLWLLGAGTLIRLLDLADYVRDEPMSIAAFFIAHLFFALLLAYLTKYFGIPKKEAN